MTLSIHIEIRDATVVDGKHHFLTLSGPYHSNSRNIQSVAQGKTNTSLAIALLDTVATTSSSMPWDASSLVAMTLIC